jgi:TPR repeat/Tetratricopeptide repeat
MAKRIEAQAASAAGGWPRRAEREAALRAIDALVAVSPDAAELRFRRADLLAALGHTEAAQQDYLAVLAREPAHYGALNDLATLLHAGGFRGAARRLYAEAALRHPANPAPQVNLANMLLEDGEFEAARRAYETALALAPDLAEAHKGMAQALAELGEDAAADGHRRRGFGGHAVTALPYRGAGEPVPLLMLVSARRGNAPMQRFIDNARFGVWAVAAEFADPAAALPPHRLVLNAIGDADRDDTALAAAAALVARSTAPVINPPARVLATARDGNARRMAGLPGVIAPAIATLPRAALAGCEGAALLGREGLRFPLLLRAPGFHTGRHFVRVEDATALAAAAASLPGERLAAIALLDAAGPDGLVRKYRVMMIDGVLYPLHLAIAADWKVHYFTAGMEDHPRRRDEEREFLTDMAGVLGRQAMAALARIRDRLGLDYAGVDFALGPAGDVLFFEANATMAINPPPPGAIWDYRRAPAERVLAAARRMLLDRAGS